MEGGGGGWKRGNKAIYKVLQKKKQKQKQKKTLKMLKDSATSTSSSASQFANITFPKLYVDMERISIHKNFAKLEKDIVKCDRCKAKVTNLQ
jgi:hypothetical protein